MIITTVSIIWWGYNRSKQNQHVYKQHTINKNPIFNSLISQN